MIRILASLRYYILIILQVLSINTIGALDSIEIIVNIALPQNSNQIQWAFYDDQHFDIVYKPSRQLQSDQLNSDTLKVDSQNCLIFEIEDKSGEGIQAPGYYEVLLDQNVIVHEELNTARAQHLVNCSRGQSCSDPIPLSPGTHALADFDQVWYRIKPNEDTYYDILTISNCDTKMWIYDNCDNIHPTDQTGAIIYNDDYKDKNAGFGGLLLKRDQTYLIRVAGDLTCSSPISIKLTDLKLKLGCMDPLACNFDPFANLDSGACIYDDCKPDLIVNEQVLKESIKVETIENTSECLVVEGCLSGYGPRDLIRFTTQIENIGNADYIVGEPIDQSPLFSKDNCHNHWHYLGYAEYLLFDSTRSALPIGIKNGFCALDYECQSDLSYKYNCDYMGISAGCYDVYDNTLLCQWIDVTDVPDGTYTLVVRVNYQKSKDFFGRSEADYDNNWAQLGIELYRDQGILKYNLIEEWDSYRDCLGIVYGNTQVDCMGVCGGTAHMGDISQDGQVDSSDLAQYLDYIQIQYTDIPMPCFDLSADDQITIYDYLLLDQCIQYNAQLSESDPLHTHCEFPFNRLNITDSIFFKWDRVDEANSEIVISYRSNFAAKSFALHFTGVTIDSFAIIDPPSTTMSSFGSTDMVTIFSDDDQLIQSQGDWTDLLRIHYSNEGNEICLNKVDDVSNVLLEKAHSAIIGSNCVSLTTTSIETIESHVENFFIYPNPSSRTIHIDNINNLSIDRMSIININGVKVITSSQGLYGSKNPIDISRLPKGIYILKVDYDTRSECHRMIVL